MRFETHEPEPSLDQGLNPDMIGALSRDFLDEQVVIDNARQNAIEHPELAQAAWATSRQMFKDPHDRHIYLMGTELPGTIERKEQSAKELDELVNGQPEAITSEQAQPRRINIVGESRRKRGGRLFMALGTIPMMLTFKRSQPR